MTCLLFTRGGGGWWRGRWASKPHRRQRRRRQRRCCYTLLSCRVALNATIELEAGVALAPICLPSASLTLIRFSQQRGCQQLWHVWPDKQSTDVIFSAISRLRLVCLRARGSQTKKAESGLAARTTKSQSDYSLLLIISTAACSSRARRNGGGEGLPSGQSPLRRWTQSMPVSAAHCHPVPMLQQPVADDVKY